MGSRIRRPAPDVFDHMTDSFDPAPVLKELRDFQRQTVKFVIRRFFDDPYPTTRFLVADPAGMGKTYVARGVIAETIAKLESDDRVDRIDVVYVCSNQDIASQNLRRLDVTGYLAGSVPKRLTLLATQDLGLDRSAKGSRKTINLIPFTPATSFDLVGHGGIAEERALLHLLLSQQFRLGRAERTASRRIFQGGVTTLDRFERHVERVADQLDVSLDRKIIKDFIRRVRHTTAGRDYLSLVDAVCRRKPTREQIIEARVLVGRLRSLLAQASIAALEPDLVILDEFQRFKHLLDPSQDNEAAVLAHHLFNYAHARVLLLSATPYKMYTLAEESALGDDHHRDFMDTVRFLGEGDSRGVEPAAVANLLAELRQSLMTGEPSDKSARELSALLRRVICRTEREDLDGYRIVSERLDSALIVKAKDFVDYATMRHLAAALDAPFTIEYWKSAPYFLNFVEGYQLGDRLREALDDVTERLDLRPLLRQGQHLMPQPLRRYRAVDLGNAKLRWLARDTVDAGWWQLLWLRPSLPYQAASGPWAEASLAQGFTKRLVFSSWAATPTAVASLLSYEAERRTAQGLDTENTPEARRSLGNRFDLRVAEGRPAAMTALALLWPMPELASACDPLRFARRVPDQIPTFDDVLAEAERQAHRIVGDNGRSTSTASDAWYWAAPMRRDRTLQRIMKGVEPHSLIDALGGTAESDSDERNDFAGISAHVQRALDALTDHEALPPRPSDLTHSAALLGLASPANVAWRALGRLLDGEHEVTPLGHWRAAAVLAAGFRTLFNRPDTTMLLDRLFPGEVYWRAVLTYCAQGDLQAVLDEYIHHLAEDQGFLRFDDEGLLALAARARAAVSLRPATYRAFDPDRPHSRGIPFLSRFALRFGTFRRQDDDARLPELRNAFNSPFRPFVLATTSIGQEGVDFHWWCHAVVHWTSPPNPVDFEQREGRLIRYKGHAIRRNVAAKHRTEALRSDDRDPWKAAFEAAAQERPAGMTEIFPYWAFPGQEAVERHVPLMPLSRDRQRYQQVRDALTLYRLAFGQPRQEDLLELLRSRGYGGQPNGTRTLVDLAPTSGDDSTDASSVSALDATPIAVRRAPT